MSDKDLIGKADGLMRRHSAVGSDTSSFPVLTDLVEIPPAAEPIETASVPQPASAADETLPGSEELTELVMRKVDQRLEAEMRRVRGEIAEAVAAAVREVLRKG